MAFSNSTLPEIIWGLGGPEEDHQLHHCCWIGRVSEREEEVCVCIGGLSFKTAHVEKVHAKIFVNQGHN